MGNVNYDENDQVTSWTEVILVYTAALKEIGTNRFKSKQPRRLKYLRG